MMFVTCKVDLLNSAICFSLIVISSLSPAQTIVFDEVSTLHVWITVSSLANRDPNNAKALLFRQIELNWINAPLEDDNDYIGLYLDSEPDGDSLPVSLHRLNGQTSGQIITDYYLPQIDFHNETKSSSSMPKNSPAQEGGLMSGSFNRGLLSTSFSANEEQQHPVGSLWRGTVRESSPQQVVPARRLLSEECVGYCLAYHSRNKILARNCLKTNPNWMLDNFQFIGPRSLPTLMIPGTHNSATYQLGQLDKSVLQMINKYQMNQDESIFNQLIYGIRYFDLRIGYSKHKQRAARFWIYHDIFRTEVPVEDVFKQVRRFLDLTSHEIVILDFHRFTVGFHNENLAVQKERHAKLIDLIFKQLGQFIVPSYLGQHAPLNEYVSAGKRLIVGYASKALLVDTQAEHQLFGMLNDKGRQQVRDSDAAKQDDLEEQQVTPSISHRLRDTNNSDSRFNGNRVLSKLKSIRILSNSFSRKWISESTGKHDSNSSKSLKMISAEEETGNQDDAASVASSLTRVALFFPPVRHLWPNKDTTDGLAQYMNETTCRKYFGELRSMMVELTPTVFGAIADKYDGNRKLAQQVNRLVTDWIRDRWSHCINIVASDFFLGNDFIRLAIYANKMRVLRRNVDLSSHSRCNSFRQVEHLLDKSKIPIQFAYEHLTHPLSADGVLSMGNTISPDIIRHTSSDGNQILLKPLAPSLSSRSIGREKRDSLVDNISDGFNDFVSSFKRLLNL